LAEDVDHQRSKAPAEGYMLLGCDELSAEHKQPTAIEQRVADAIDGFIVDWLR